MRGSWSHSTNVEMKAGYSSGVSEDCGQELPPFHRSSNVRLGCGVRVQTEKEKEECAPGSGIEVVMLRGLPDIMKQETLSRQYL